MDLKTVANLINRVDSVIGSHDQAKQEVLLLQLKDFLEWHVIALYQNLDSQKIECYVCKQPEGSSHLPICSRGKGRVNA